MGLLYSENLSPAMTAPPFELRSVDGKTYRLADFSEKVVLGIFFPCNHCPYVQAIEDRLIALGRFFEGRSVQFLGICSNDPTDYPEDSPAKLFQRWKSKAYGFPYLIDDTQEVARAYGAVCTPDLYVFDASRTLAYHGRLDDSWKDPARVTREELKEAVTALLENRAPSPVQHPSMGCSIKWKKSP